MIRVLVVDDSAVVRELLTYILDSDSELEVVGAVGSAEEALDAVQRLRPDVVTMDINMPQMNGFETTRLIMETHPTPIVIVSGSWDANEVATTFHTLEAGALAVLQRPPGIGHPDHVASSQQLVQTVKLMSEVKVVRRWPRTRVSTPPFVPRALEPKLSNASVNVIAIGTSTGGPVVVQSILSALPKDFPIPLLIVQHMAAGFVRGFVEWLAQTCNRPVHVAEHAVRVQSGHAYVAPDAFHMGIDSNLKIMLHRGKPENGLCPSVSYLFRSVVDTCGPNTIGVLLTGMGKDGAEELKLMRERGAITLAQDSESSVIHGMPGEAIRIGGATYVLSPEQIAAALSTLTKQ